MFTETHPSNPPTDATGFKSETTETHEIAYWMQASKPDFQSKQAVAYKAQKIGNQYLVVWAREVVKQAKIDLNTLKKGDRFKLFETDNFNYILLGNYPTYVRYKVESDCGSIMNHQKSWPTIMVIILNK